MPLLDPQTALVNQIQGTRPGGLLGQLFDLFVPNQQDAVNNVPFGPAQIGSGMGPYGLPIKDRLAALMESPSYFDQPLAGRLALLKGQPNPSANTGRLMDLIHQAKNFTTTQHQFGNRVGKAVPSEQLIPQGWISKLIQGGRR
jgi:hypothetical protein